MLQEVATLWGLALIGLVSSSPGGPPAAACLTMSPDPNLHTAPAQTTTAPYTLTLSKNTYSPGEQITVTLSGNSASDTFKGFFIQPRTDVDTLSIVGTFSTIPAGSKLVACSGLNGLAHNSATVKSSISATWTAPNQDVGSVYFMYTIVKEKVIYWVKVQAGPITYQSSGSAGPTQPTTPLPDIVINWDPNCGHTKFCFPTSNECHINCDYLVKWWPAGDNETVEFSLQRKATGNQWIAIGFSDDRAMGNDSVVECASVNNSVAVHTSYNIVKNPSNGNNPLSIETFGISHVATSHIDGILSCTFRRKISANLVAGANAGDVEKFFDLRTSWYLLVAMGDMSGTTKQKHSSVPKITTEKIDFLAVGTSTDVPTAGPTGEIVKQTECGLTEGCFHDCDGTGKACTFYFGYRTDGDNTCMKLYCKQGANKYCAIGFSNDQQMGDDYVIEAVADGSNVAVYSSFNIGTSNERLSPGDYGISGQSCSYNNGIISCQFCRKTTYASVTGRRKRAAVGASNYFDLTTDYYLFYAHGSAAGVAISQHDKIPVSTAVKADLQSTTELGAQAVGMATLVLVHIILMVIAWMLFASVGIASARFYKPAWPKDTKIFGLAIWFQIHRACMVLAFLCCAASFVVIFIHVDGYADDIEGSNFVKAHPIMGIVVMALATINPFMSLLRCAPDHPRRPVFNVAHFVVGIGAYVIGIVNIFAGVELADEKVPDYVMIILWVFCGWVVLYTLVLHLYDFASKRTGTRGESYELKSGADSSQGLTAEKEGKRDTFKIIALVLHILIVAGLAIAVCVVIGLESGGGGEGGDDHSHEEE